MLTNSILGDLTGLNYVAKRRSYTYFSTTGTRPPGIKTWRWLIRYIFRGVMGPPIDQLTADGYDLQFGTNVLGHYYLTILLMPALLAGTKTSGDGYAWVVNTSSSVHWGSGLEFNISKESPARKNKGESSLYAQSKTVSFSGVGSQVLGLTSWM